MSAPLQRVLVVDDAVPRAALGAGHPRGLAVVKALAALARRVDLLPSQRGLGTDVAIDPLPENVAVLDGAPEDALLRALADAPVDLLWIGRPNNLAWVERIARIAPAAFARSRIVYDAEALFALRDARRRALEGTPMSDVRLRHALRQELHPAHLAAAIAAVSEPERRAIADVVPRPVHVLGYPAAPRVAAAVPDGRGGALFVGSLSPADSPNGDALQWLLREVWPRVAQPFTLAVAGRGAEPDGWLAPFAGDAVRLLGPVPDVAPLYASARAFVAPTRYAAGIPLKVIEAAQHGVPVVATPLVAELLGWRDGVELLVGHDARSFAAALDRLSGDGALWRSLSAGALAALQRDLSPAAFEASVRALAGAG
ncbi:MAG TPA: glycosyltransferase family 4 protein [Casimicrobiaceae bacterium]|nr:glycosyltransferase family 4 protein [Casimicrobiaceae bacterium]